MIKTKPKPLIVYKASAGSGKTFTLATEYIKLVVENPMSYRTILAVTFTNKATEEMKMRILSQLYGIWKMLPDSKAYSDKICKELDASPEFVASQAGIALTNLLHNYNYFWVETIDTFFQSVLRNLARELDLSANLRIGLNDAQVEELAVDQLIEDLASTDVILQWIMKYIMENIEEDRGWNVIGQIKSFGKTIFRDYYKNASKQLNEKIQSKDFFEQYTKKLRVIRKNAKERMEGYADTFFNILKSDGLGVDDLSYGKSGVAGFFLKLKNGVMDESILGKRVTDCVGEPEKWCKKTHPRRELIMALADGELGQVLRHAIEDRTTQWKLFKSADLTLKHLNQLRLLNSIEKKVNELNTDANRFLLSNTQELLHTLISESDSPFIFEKIGTQLEHVMIDEFQDTGVVQWHNFKVLLQECMSHEGTENLIVGDVKQSIYRWRSGDWRLLNDIEQEFPYPEQQLEIVTLDTNYRSEPHVVEFNNQFFKNAASIEYEAQKELNSSGAEQLKKAYADVNQLIPSGKSNAGLVDIKLLPSKDYEETTLTQLVEIVEELKSRHVPLSQIACLVRTNNQIPIIARYFMEHCPEVRIVSDEAFRLDASLCVNMLVNALRLLVHPDDKLVKANIVKGYQCHVLSHVLNDNELLLNDLSLDNALPESYIGCFEQLCTLPLYELTEKLYGIFELGRLEGQEAYYCTFLDEMAKFLTEQNAGIEEFLHYWDSDICKKTIQSDAVEGIRLISIHKSKGLEFPHVIIPFCDWQLEKQSGNIIWCQPTEAPFSELPLVPIDYSQKQLVGTIYEKDYLHEHLQNTVDNLNLLYVAFTRASHNLFVIGKRKTKASRSAVIEQVLYEWETDRTTWNADFTISGIDDEEEAIHFQYGTLSIPHADGGKVRATENVFLQPVSTLHVDIEAHDTNVEFWQSNKSREFIDLAEGITEGLPSEGHPIEKKAAPDYIHIGNVLHNVFSRIRTSNDVDAVLQELQLEGILYGNNITPERITSMLRKRLSDPRVADWFSGRWTLYNECTILNFDTQTNQVVERRPDRVMTDGDETIVVDFKFGRPQEEYHDQVREYMELLKTMGHKNVRGYLWFVYSNVITEVK